MPPYAPEVDPIENGLSVLVVDPSLEDLLLTMSRLTRSGFRVTAADSFAQAKGVIASRPPALLVTAVRLGAYNGLHLVLRAKSARPDVAAIVISAVDDPVLQADAEAMGATFMVTPVEEKDLIAAVLQTIFRSDASVGPIRPPFERRLGERRTAQVSMHHERRVSDRRRVRPWLSA
jgi:PleD family two-component response regulator